MPAREYFAKNLRRFREVNQLTQFEAGEDMGISKDTVSSIERELKSPTLDTVQKVAAYMGITAAELLTNWEETDYQPPKIK